VLALKGVTEKRPHNNMHNVTLMKRMGLRGFAMDLHGFAMDLYGFAMDLYGFAMDL
jgi:hypothetical protein